MKKTLVIIGLCIILMFSLVSADLYDPNSFDNPGRVIDGSFGSYAYKGDTRIWDDFSIGVIFPPKYLTSIRFKARNYCDSDCGGASASVTVKSNYSSWVNVPGLSCSTGSPGDITCDKENNSLSLISSGLIIAFGNGGEYEARHQLYAYEIEYDGNFSIDAKDVVTDEYIQSFNVTINGTNYESVNGSVITGINATTNVTLNITIFAVNYSIKNVVLNTSDNSFYTFVLNHPNSVDFYLKDENSGDNITSQVNITMSNLDNEYINQTSTGHIYLEDLNAGVYTVKFEAQNYTTKFYGLTISNTSHSELTAYLGNYTDEVIFTVKSQDSGIIIDGAIINFNKRIDGEWATVGSKFTDVTGKAQFYYDNSAEYNIVISKDGYETKNTILNPILYDNYNVNLETETGFAETSISSDVFFSFTPTTFVNGNNSFDFTISSPSGSLTNYVLNVSYPDSYVNRSGNNAIGGSFEFNFTTDAELFDQVTVDVIYNTSLGENTHKTYSYYIPVNETEGTWLGMGTYGMGLFERFLIATLFVLFLAGFTFVLVGSDAGLVIGGLIYGFFVIVGFIPLWGIIPTLFAIMILLMRGGSS